MNKRYVERGEMGERIEGDGETEERIEEQLLTVENAKMLCVKKD